ncbi:transcription initiation factor IID, 31kD subunit-domain-containing protein [Morchella snyderi]|nr:transcription initiation factor IID, 31kD subunit-domain-containing protein [Morchella snyderi]
MADTNGSATTAAAAAGADADPQQPSSSTAAAAATTTTTTTTTTDDPAKQPAADAPPAGTRKPRDARIIHLILASMGVSSYQERVPLMLMDFAYRYTSSVLQDALLFSDAIHSTTNTGGPNPPSSVTLADLRMSVASRINHQFNTALPKEFLLDIAQERNRVALPTVGKEFGVRLPPEKYSLTGISWELAETREDWMAESSGEEEEEGVGVGGGGGEMELDDGGDLFADQEEEDSSMVDA